MKKCTRLRKASAQDIAAIAQPETALIKLPVGRSYDPSRNEFCFLNLKAAFPKGIDWNYSAYGALWAYNLNYFEWLYDDALSVAERLQTIRSYVASGQRINIGLDGYPISLRVVSWTRFLLRYDVKEEALLSALFQHADWLCRFPEYSLDGNHLWENAVALVCAGLFFHNDRFYRMGGSILTACLRGQLFEDGGHAEGSPMYHSLLLWRLLQCLELVRAIPLKEDELPARLEQAAEKMLGWLRAVTFSDGSWPAVNDCTGGIAPTTEALMDYARQLRIGAGNTAAFAIPVLWSGFKDQPLRHSQYRMIHSGQFELFIDAADIYPSCQPGHAHADTGTFCLHVAGRPLIVDTGISTYAESAMRRHQRSTAAHNTVCINGLNSSDVWKSFRVGRRARITRLHESDHTLTLAHDGYEYVRHERTFSWSGHAVSITDSFESRGIYEAILYLHFHPDTALTQLDDCTFSTGKVLIHIEAAAGACIRSYEYAAGFNDLRKAKRIEATAARDKVITIIDIA